MTDDQVRRLKSRMLAQRAELDLLRDFTRHPFADITVPQRVEEVIAAVREEHLTYLREDDLRLLAELVVEADRAGREGVVVECGTALGGSAIVMAAARASGRPMRVFDVFGMIPPPTQEDGRDVHDRYEAIRRGESSGLGGQTYYGYREDLLGEVTASFARLGVPVGRAGSSSCVASSRTPCTSTARSRWLISMVTGTPRPGSAWSVSPRRSCRVAGSSSTTTTTGPVPARLPTSTSPTGPGGASSTGPRSTWSGRPDVAPRVIHTAQALVDVVVEVPSLPRRGGNVMADVATRHAGGAVTILLAAVRSGVEAVHAGAHGRGPNGDLVRETLAAEGVVLSAPVVEDLDTGTCLVLVEPSAERTFVTTQEAERHISVESLATSAPVAGDLVCVSGYSLVGRTRDPLVAWLESLPEGVVVVLDPGDVFAELEPSLRSRVVALTDVWTGNAEESEHFGGAKGMGPAAEAVAALLEPGAVAVVRDGDRGAPCGSTG